MKPKLLKLFLLDAQGGYRAEFVLDEECVAEYGDFLAAVPESGLADGQSIFLGELKATALHGEHFSLIALSKGPVGREHVAWARAALVAAEAAFTEIVAGAPPPGPDRGVLESLSRALEEREAQIQVREAALAETEARAGQAAAQHRADMDAQIEELRSQLAAARAQHEEDVKALAAERDRLHRELQGIASEPEGAAALDADRAQLDRDRKFLQRRALDLLAREEAVRVREAKVEDEAISLERSREEWRASRAKAEAVQAAPPAFDVEAARREIEMRVKILQQKAFDLLDREEKLRAQTEQLKSLLPS